MRTASELTISALLAAVLLLGCATAPERYLSLEEDAKMRQACVQGCVTVPAGIWRQIEQILHAIGMRQS